MKSALLRILQFKMKHCLVFIIILFYHSIVSYSKSFENDSITFQVQRGNDCFLSFHYDSAEFSYHIAANFFEEKNDLLNAAKNTRLCSQSFYNLLILDSALIIAQKALKFEETMSPDSFDKICLDDKIETELLLSDIYWQLRIFSSQLSHCQDALKIYTSHRMNNELLLAKIYIRFSYYYFSNNNLDSAYYFGRKSYEMQIGSENNDMSELAESMNQLGMIYNAKSQFDSSIVYLLQAADLLTLNINGKCQSVDKIYYNLGVGYYGKGEYLFAIKYLKKFNDISIWLYGKDYPNSCYYYSCLGLAYMGLGNYNIALDYILKSLKLAISKYGFENYNTAGYYTNTGVIYESLGEYEKAIEFYEKALSIKTKKYDVNHFDVALNYYNIAVDYRRIGDLKKALDASLKSLEIRKNLNNESINYLANSYSQLGEIFNDMGNFSKANEKFKEAENIILTYLGAHYPDLTELYEDWSLVYFNMSDYDTALIYLKKALQIATVIYDSHHPAISRINTKIGDVYQKKSNYLKSMEFYRKALIANTTDSITLTGAKNLSLKNILSQPILLNTLSGQAICFNKLFSESDSISFLDSSLATYNSLFELIKQMRTVDNIETSKLLLSSNTKIFFKQAMGVALIKFRRNSCDQNAFMLSDISEKGKGAVMSSYLNEVNARMLSGIPDSLIKEEKYLKTEIDLLKTEKEKSNQNDSTPGKFQSLDQGLFIASYKYDSINNYLEKNFPKYSQIKYSQSIVSVNQIHSALDKKSALISYFIGDTNLFISIITDSSYNIETTKIDSNFAKLTIAYYRAIKKSDVNQCKILGEELYKILIQPIAKIIRNKQNLIIIPDEYLFYVPFESLNSGRNDNMSTQGIEIPDYLIYSHNITYHYSATLWYNSVKEMSAKKSESQGFIGFAPVFDKITKNGEILTSNLREIDTSNFTISNRSFSKNMKDFNPLPESKLEIEEILRLFEQKGKRASAYLYKNASEENLKTNLKGYKYVHIATHGFSNDTKPMLSGLAFSQPSDTGNVTYDSVLFEYKVKGEDGILYAGEAYNLDLNADLVVLSSCDGGIGKLSKGEGLLSMTRGFLYSGTPNILYSLYKVSDKHTKDLMTDFYTGVLAGKSYADALRQAKLNMINNEATSSPFFWSGFVLLGR